MLHCSCRYRATQRKTDFAEERTPPECNPGDSIFRVGHIRHNSRSNLHPMNFEHSTPDYWGQLVRRSKKPSLQCSASMESVSVPAVLPLARLSKPLHYTASLRTW